MKGFLAFPCCTQDLHVQHLSYQMTQSWSPSPAQHLFWKICWNHQQLKVQSPLKILVSVILQSIGHRVAIFLFQVFKKHQTCYAYVSQMVCAWKHMAFIVHIHTICPVYRPKKGPWLLEVLDTPHMLYSLSGNRQKMYLKFLLCLSSQSLWNLGQR